ncbi:D-inositol-3-phosphate glycosyltransferase [subsurface metagenome]
MIVCNSKNTLRSFYKFEKFLIRNKQKKIIYNGVDIEWIDKEYMNKEIALQKWNLEDRFVIGNIGRLIEQKDQKTIILGMKDIIKKISYAKLVIVGSGRLEKNLKKLVIENGLGKYVCFTGALNRGEVYRLLHCFDVFVMSSLWEGFCNAVVEAMAAKTPVIVTKVGPLPEVVGDSGIYVSPNDPQVIINAILELKNNPKMAKKMGEAARKRVIEKFSIQKTVENYEKLYEQLLKEKNRILYEH